jgi:hypothetical protein
VLIAKWMGLDPEVVKEWDEATADDVRIVMRAAVGRKD